MRRRNLFTLAAGASGVLFGRMTPAILTPVLIALAAGCSPPTSGPTPAPLPRASAEAHHEQAYATGPATQEVETRHSDDPIEEQWLTEVRDRPAAGRNQFVQLDILMRILRGVPEAQFGRELERLRQLPDEPSEFELLLLQASVAILADRGDDARLTNLLATTCPRYFGGSRVECRIDRGHLANPVAVLTNATRLTTTRENRQILAQILTEAFRSIAARFQIPELSRVQTPATHPHPGQAGAVQISKELESFLTECERWYAENRSRVHRNPEYDSNDSEAFTKKHVDLYFVD